LRVASVSAEPFTARVVTQPQYGTGHDRPESRLNGAALVALLLVSLSQPVLRCSVLAGSGRLLLSVSRLQALDR